MRLGERITRRLVGMESGSLSHHARARRFEMLVARFPDLPSMRVLDLGGEPHTWLDAPVRPREIVMLNLESRVAGADFEATGGTPWMQVVQGNACDPPDQVRGDRFDLVFSNSVLEHVGGHARRAQFARWARELGRHYWVQTPNRYFPIEPHWVFPGFQFLPDAVAARTMMRWPIGNFSGRKWTYERALHHVRATELVSERQLRGYFPDATILAERFGGLKKSLIAVR